VAACLERERNILNSKLGKKTNKAQACVSLKQLRTNLHVE
jgi:hypothetical protein